MADEDFEVLKEAVAPGSPAPGFIRYFARGGNLFIKKSSSEEKNATGISFAQTSVAGIAQVISSSVPVKITGLSTFIGQYSEFDNGGANDLTLRYITPTPRFVKFEWCCVVREDPDGGGSDGTVIVNLAVGGVVIAVAKCTTSVDANHGGSVSGVFVRNVSLNEVFELFASRESGGGNGAILDVVFVATVLP